MTLKLKIKNAMMKSTKILSLATAVISLFTPATILMLSNGCAARVVVVSSDQTETRLTSGQPFTPGTDGVFMGMGRYQRYRQAVADAIEKESVTNK